MTRIKVDERTLEVPDGSSILDAMALAGVDVPRLCDDPRVAPVGVCRLCLVELRGSGKRVPACTTAVVDGMDIATAGPELDPGRREILQMLARRMPADGGEHRLGQALRAHGVAVAGTPDAALVDDSHAYIRVDMNKCIDCFLCERICRDLQGQDTWHATEREGRLRLVADTGAPLGHSSCVSCGACADACPSGALEDRSLAVLGRPERVVRTTCPYCGVGCELDVGVRGDRIVQVRPPIDAPVNKGHLCVKGRYAFGFVDASDRVTQPMLRDGDRWHPVSWDEALAHVAGRLTAIRRSAGPDAIGLLGSARATNEDNYVTQKLARVVIGTNNVDSCARVCHAPSAAALSAMLGTGAATSSFDDIERARTIVVFGANATESHPIVGARIRQAARRGARLIVIDPRRTELAAMADLHLQLRAGTDLPLLHALAHVILGEDLVDHAFVRARVTGLAELQQAVAPWTPERAAAECELDADRIRAVARAIASERPTLSVHGLGLTEHVQGTETVMAMVNLALLTGNVGVPGAGVNPLRGQNNVQGAAHMGCEPNHLTGYALLDEGRARFERVWGAPVPQARGLDLMEMIEAARDGRLRALWAIGYDVALTNPDAERTLAALGNLELVVVQDLFFTETARRFATVFLPAASSFEKDGTFMNAERRVQRVRRAVTPRGGARADWEIVCGVAAAMGHAEGFAFGSAREIWDEIRELWPAGAGLAYDRLERGGLQWPCPAEDHPGTQVLHAHAFARGPTAALHVTEHRTPEDACDADFPLALITGRRLYQFNAGTMTGRTPNNMWQPGDVLEMSPADAARHELVDGELVDVTSRHGHASLPLAISERVRDGELFATFHTPEVFLNHVIGPATDAITHTPAYKRTAVRVARRT